MKPYRYPLIFLLVAGVGLFASAGFSEMNLTHLAKACDTMSTVAVMVAVVIGIAIMTSD
jgi:hypothetical protein